MHYLYRMRRTNLIDLKTDDPVNLERSIAADGRNSGHFVQGHVDTTGIIEVCMSHSVVLKIPRPGS